MSESPQTIAGNPWDMLARDTSRFVPDVVVVALGANDFSPGDNLPEDPRPSIVAMSSPMLGNGWPNPTDTFADDLRAAVGAVAERFVAAGDTQVVAFEISAIQGQGCGTHPDAEQHAALGEELAAELGHLGF